ncbi:MAG: hypothetical protein RBU29_04010 [bacterium]|nr:hypothetical protein [bacterium]
MMKEKTARATHPTLHAFVLIEVLLSMTILAICSGVLLRSISNSIKATEVARDITKAVYLTQIKLREFEALYSEKANYEYGEFRGRYEQPGSSKFRWRAEVDYDPTYDAVVITVQTLWGEERAVRGYRRRFADLSTGYVLKTMVPMIRYNEELQRGGIPSKRPRQERRQGGQGAQGRR